MLLPFRESVVKKRHSAFRQKPKCLNRHKTVHYSGLEHIAKQSWCCLVETDSPYLSYLLMVIGCKLIVAKAKRGLASPSGFLLKP